jgi:hypothetical protein
MSKRSEKLATTLEQGARALADLAGRLTDAEWKMNLPKDGRPIGVVIHHVADIYPLEIQLAQKLADGGELTDVTWPAVHQLNAGHARDHHNASKEDTLALLSRNAAAAAAVVRAMTDEQLDKVAPNSMYGGAPLTCQFFLEDHAVRHSFHHAARIREALTVQV